MARPQLDYLRAARVLIDATLFGDEKASSVHGITTRTIRRWRERMDEDDKLSGAVRATIERVQEGEHRHWTETAPPVFASLMNEIKRKIAAGEGTLGELVDYAETLGRLMYTAEALGVTGQRDRGFTASTQMGSSSVSPFRR